MGYRDWMAPDVQRFLFWLMTILATAAISLATGYSCGRVNSWDVPDTPKPTAPRG